MNFLTADVPDPTDFPPQPSAPGLRTLDGSFRCNICGELFDAPVTISCGHCFCSACIRSALSTKQECPSCRKSAGEAHIRPNPALESVISAWKEARPFVLDLISRERERKMSEGAPFDGSPSKKRKRSNNQSPSVEPPRSSAGPSRHEMDLATPKATPKVKKFKPTSSSPVVPSSDAEEDEIMITGSSNHSLKDNDMVICPMCSRKVPFGILNTHMDKKCKDASKPASTANDWSKLLTGAGKNNQNSNKKGKQKKNGSDSDDEYPLPLASYNTLKDRQLKDMLSEHGLPLTGDRSTWEQRHQHWVILYNSNLDKSVANRRTKADLKRDLKKWEEDMAKKRKQPTIDSVSYQKTHKSEFTRLIDEAKKSRAQPPPNLKQSDSSSSAAEPKPRSGSSPSGEIADDTIVVDSEDERTGVLR
ncbi:hypothetical protein D9619_005602 [Psilocybe cf. subviscida]|uniref:Postreplication repair E3 ubiquitin-protein ligase RAD18 n=1 Tax=Psilocybe cf. subviscida TaxID=2480587 RepID=A0A8H5BXM0_9AGAR|nr:hypothetical protein D9619_005602 [Psilocybe cf. subviscida]